VPECKRRGAAAELETDEGVPCGLRDGCGELLELFPAIRRSSAAATFSSKCLTDEVPGIGSITEERIRSQASFGDERGAPGALS
jgi:hypothetical protein